MTLAQRLHKMRVLFMLEARRDIQNQTEFASKYLWIFFLCLIYKFFLQSGIWGFVSVENHPIDFALFLVSGLALSRILPLAVNLFEDTLAGLKSSRLTEWVASTPTSFWELFAAKGVWNAIRALTEFLFFIASARFLLGTTFGSFFKGGIFLSWLLVFGAYAGLGMALSGFKLFFKQSRLSFTFFVQISMAFGGIFFPVHLLTSHSVFLSAVSKSLPVTHGLDVIRLTLIGAPPVGLGFLAAQTFLLLLLGSAVLGAALVWAKNNQRLS